MRERDLYGPVCQWFKNFLSEKFRNATVNVYNTSTVQLSKFLFDKGYYKFFPMYQTFEIQVDITGIIKRKDRAYLAIIECKIDEISLRDLSQLIGYSKVCLPIFSLIISPKGISKTLHLLFNVWKRYDVLTYSDKRRVSIAKWLVGGHDIDISSIIPPGELND